MSKTTTALALVGGLGLLAYAMRPARASAPAASSKTWTPELAEWLAGVRVVSDAHPGLGQFVSLDLASSSPTGWLSYLAPNGDDVYVPVTVEPAGFYESGNVKADLFELFSDGQLVGSGLIGAGSPNDAAATGYNPFVVLTTPGGAGGGLAVVGDPAWPEKWTWAK